MTAIDPRFSHTIPISAMRSVPFTPRVLDAERMLREDMEPLERAQLDLDRDRTRPQDVATEGLPDEGEFARRQVAIDAAKTKARSAYETLLQSVPTPPVFMLKTPTPIERDQINTRLMNLGLVSIDTKLIRASMIEAIFEHDWNRGDAAANEAHAEELAAFMDGIWQRERVAQEASAAWEAQEIERMLDEQAGAPARPRADLPPSIITPRESARATMLIDEIQKTPRMKAIMSRQFDFERHNAQLLVRLAVREVKGLAIYPPLKVDPGTDTLLEEDVTALRGAMEEAYGPTLSSLAWDELCRRIDASYTLEGFEVGNSVSPPEKPKTPDGSIGRSGDTEASGGSSTTSPTTPPPADVFETTTERLFGSTTDVAVASSPVSASPTDAH